MSTRNYFVDPAHVAATEQSSNFSIEDEVLESLGVIANYSAACRLALRSTTEPTSRDDVLTWLVTINRKAHSVAEAMRDGPKRRI